MLKSLTCFQLQTIALTLLCIVPTGMYGQLQADLSTTDNTNCDGAPCSYNGPSILINELMLSPLSFDGSMWGGNAATQAGEWIELYNPNICESVDISCYYLGNNANDPTPYPGGYVIPPGTVVPPAGFALIRGMNAAPVPPALLVQNGGNVVELVVDGDGVCVGGGSRLWFPNAGGWFAFYDSNGVPQDAVSWANQSNLDQSPCVPTLSGCGITGPLANYDEFPNDRKSYILNTSAADHQGESIRRLPDGGVWSQSGTPTYATCNGPCIDPIALNCNGSATAMPQGGTPPYSYLWDDPQSQSSQTANNLCAGSYCVLITDALGATIQECVMVEDALFENNTAAGFCQGQTYTLPDNTTVSTPGVYTVTFQTGFGCDSLVTVDLEMYPTYSSEIDVEICANQSYTLPDGSEVQTAGNYVFTYASVHGCDSVLTVNVAVLPPVDVAQNVEICSGSTHTLPDGSEADQTGVYTVLMPGGAVACDTLYTVDVLVWDPFVPAIDDRSDISCFGESDGSASLSITGTTGPYTLSWSDGIDHGLDPNGLEAGTYSVNIADSHGCEAELSFDIAEPTPVLLSATADTLICLGAESQLQANASGGTGAFTYHWSHTASANGNSAVSPAQNTDYTVYATDENGCETETLTLEVEVISMEAVLLQLMPGEAVCDGEETTLEAFYNGDHPPYNYTWSDGLPNGPGPHLVSPGQSTNYEVSVTDACGNEVTGQLEITIWPQPEATISTTDVTCNGINNGSASIVLAEGTPDFEFIWSDGQDHGATPTSLGPGNYTVQIFDANACSTDVAFTIAEPEPLLLTATADTLICFGASSQLQANASGGTGTFTYHWSHTASANDNSIVSPTQDTDYTVYATDENGCETETLTLAVDVINMEAGLLSITGDTTICEGSSAALYALYAGSYPPYVYNWSGGLSGSPGPHAVAPSTTTSYTVTVSDVCGNAVTAEVSVEVLPLPEISLPDLLLNGCSPFETSLYDSINTAPGFVHEWIVDQNGSVFGNPASLAIEAPGTYEVLLVVSSPEGCSDTSATTIPVEVYALPEADFDASPWSVDIAHPEIAFSNTSEGYVSSIWFIDGDQYFNQNEIYHSFADTGSYAVQLIVENEFGCRDSITKWVNIGVVHDVEVPNAFTPSTYGDDPNYDPGSTTNTIFYPFSQYVSELHMSIFNRWGELIFESNALQKGWNGTYRDKPCPQDVYVYKIDFVFTDGYRKTEVGDITLFR